MKTTETEYYKSGRHKVTVRKNTAKYIRRNQQFVLDYLKSHPCVDCGESNPVVLEFDHITSDKISAISAMIWRPYSTEKIAEEIAKCVVRCANCHRRKTNASFGWFRHVSD